uniref:Uncharacterized protein n=1 Tax=Oryza brachyantha TaxID=4533 RepID=J3M6S5_ORYBR
MAQANISLGRLSLHGGDRTSGHHIVKSFTDDELDQVIDDRLDVPVFDNEGWRRYDFRCGYLDYSAAAEEAYQLVGIGDDYELFMTNNNVVRDVSHLGKGVSLLVFAFRSEGLLAKQTEGDAASGALCMVILFFVGRCQQCSIAS